MTPIPRITDWDDAYANRAHIPDADAYIERWEQESQLFRMQHSNATLNVSYASSSQNDTNQHRARLVYDVFEPQNQPSKGLLFFVHGGYWVAFSKDTWSCFAKGANDAGYTVVIPSYPLCPTINVTNISECISACVTHAAEQIEGPIVLTGHSAGGHLVTSLVSYDALSGDYASTGLLKEAVVNRVKQVVSISGVHDLRPLLNTKLNQQLKLDVQEATRCSPALLTPLNTCPVTVWVGGTERSEFIRQSELLANVWRGLGAQTSTTIEPDLHHFNVIDGLMKSDSVLMQTALNSLTMK